MKQHSGGFPNLMCFGRDLDHCDLLEECESYEECLAAEKEEFQRWFETEETGTGK